MLAIILIKFFKKKTVKTLKQKMMEKMPQIREN